MDTWNEHDEVIDVDINQNDTNVSFNSFFDKSESLSDDGKKKMLPFPKVSKNLNYQDFQVSVFELSSEIVCFSFNLFKKKKKN